MRVTQYRSTAAAVGVALALVGVTGGCVSSDDVTTTASAAASATASATTSSLTGSTSTAAILSAATAFVGTLSDSEKSSAVFDWSNVEQKARWSNLPQGLFTRAGLMWGKMSDASKTAWLAVMKATLSEAGYKRVLAEWRADDELAGGGSNSYGQQYYWVALIGTPSASSPWQWQWGGHHVTVNATVSGDNLALSPSFIGAQPTSFTDSGATVEPLGDIWDAAYATVKSLDGSTKSSAVLGSSYIDLLYGPGEDDKEPVYEGVQGSKLTDAQKKLLLALIGKYTGLANDGAATTHLAEIEATIDDTYFCWYGPTTDTGDAYFRVTGPRVIIEYSPQSMGGSAADHIHGIYRDPKNEYGAAITG
ncbi:hypothetical protein DMB66_42950 [Actinoplanes sp. ATCC 53533]|uniref:DUF3500 domain-containing protein n=2 Tax=Actinoplanes sp. ATCC 53533 TaxID=1288362 RepID=UPI000F7BA15F|nr:DUF3500 domain-containing protein [Actinoplanes sp. ATCC 53533]RSM51033.1 hypothetical protein DMB66_42950 [Actinoplanes sp. ATCC 53533]